MDDDTMNGVAVSDLYFETHVSVPTLIDFLTIYGGLFTSISGIFYAIKAFLDSNMDTFKYYELMDVTRIEEKN
jgi:hypothetical protein